MSKYDLRVNSEGEFIAPEAGIFEIIHFILTHIPQLTVFGFMVLREKLISKWMK